MIVKKKRRASETSYIAAIGASAGGLEALQKVISHVPRTTKNIAFIIVQHLSPNYKSMLGQSISGQTNLTVVEVENEMQVKAGTIYITPPDREITIKKGKLYLNRPPRTYNPRPSINNLFSSLAEDQKERSIGIILSGTGTDGANGLKKIEDAGGITLVQDPKSAKFNSMPHAAIAAGHVDFVLTAEEIGSQLGLLVSKAHKNPRTSKLLATKEKVFEDIIELLSREKGTDFTNYKRETLFRRINKRFTDLKYTSVNHYFKYLEKTPHEVDELFNMVLIGVTTFFRDAAVFKNLEKYIAHLIDSKAGSESLRIWVPGCASGEEAYSIAIMIDSVLKKKNRIMPVQIFATDINEKSLSVARKGIYPKNELQHVPAEIISNYFMRVNSSYELHKAVRSMVLFSKHDLTHNPPFLKLDLIVCRNLLIYFNTRLQEYIFPVFYSALNPSGYLLLGKSESIGHFNDLFTTVKRDSKIYQRKFGTPLRTIRYTPLKIKEPLDKNRSQDFTIREMVKETLYKTYDHPYVVVNDAMNLQEIGGDVSLYMGLKQGQMNADLIKQAHKDLKIELRSLFQRCVKENKEVASENRKIISNGKDHYVKIIVRPLLYSASPDEFYLIIFQEIKPEPTSKKISPSHSKTDTKQVKELELELEATKADLQGFIDRLEDTNTQLQSLNEELQSSNEELKISNEELETANEELQSANEEINIAYAELKAANETLEEQGILLRKSDIHIQALLNNTLQSFILLDKNLNVIAFNEMAVKTMKKIFGLEISAGDPFQNFFSKEKMKKILPDFKNAIKGKTIRTEHDLTDAKKRNYTFIFNFTPIVNEERKIESVSFSMLDITELKRTKIELAQSEGIIESVFHTAGVGIAILNSAGKFVKVNDEFNKLIGYSKNELSGKPYIKMIARDGRNEAKVFETFLHHGKKESFEQRVIGKDGRILDVWVTNSLFINPAGEKYVIKTMRDVTDEKKYKDLLLNAEKLMRMGSFEYNLITKNFTCTNAMRTIFEVDKDFTITANSIKKFGQESDKQKIDNAYKNLIQHRKNIDMECRIRTGKGNEKWVYVRSFPITLKSKVVAFSGTLLDITARKIADREIERLSWVAKHTNSGVVITDSHGKIEWINQSFERITGYTLFELKGKLPGKILHGVETDKERLAKMQQRLQKGLAASEVLLNFTKKKRPIWVSTEITPIFDGERKLRKYIWMLTDITELIEAKEIQRIRESSEQRQNLLEAMAGNFPDGIIGVIDRSLEYIFVDGSELKKLGRKRSEMIGHKIFDEISLEANVYAEPFLKRAFGGENVHFEVVVEKTVYAVLVVPMLAKEKSIAHALVVIQNITSRKIAETEMLRALKQQRELNELKSRFVTQASHEFRTPLGTILTSAHLVEQYNDLGEKEDIGKHIKRIKSSVRSLTEILNEFLSLSKIEEGHEQNNPSVFNVKDFCTELTEEMTAQTKNGQVIIYQHQGKTAMISLDKTHIKNVLLNLLSNAIKYSHEGQTIRFKSTLKKNSIIFVVQDEGIGIPENDTQHLFKTFFRARNATNIQGTGLGLHIVKRYLDMMGGTIEFKSELNKRTTFTVKLPQATASK